MANGQQDTPQPSSEIIFYQTEDGHNRIEVRLENETVWLTQQLMAELFKTTKQNIGQHLKNIFTKGELQQDSVVKKSFTTATDGKRYETLFYNHPIRAAAALQKLHALEPVKITEGKG